MNIINYITDTLFAHVLGLFQQKSSVKAIGIEDNTPVSTQLAVTMAKECIHQLRLEATLEMISVSHRPVHGALGSELADCVKHRNVDLMFEMADRLERQMMYATKSSA